MRTPLSLAEALTTFVLLAGGAVLAATLQRIATRRAPPDAPQIACMAGATVLYALNLLLRPGRLWGTVLIAAGLLLAGAAIAFFLRGGRRR